MGLMASPILNHLTEIEGALLCLRETETEKAGRWEKEAMIEYLSFQVRVQDTHYS